MVYRHKIFLMKLSKLTFMGLQIVDSYKLTYLKYSNLC